MVAALITSSWFCAEHFRFASMLSAKLRSTILLISSIDAPYYPLEVMGAIYLYE
jgi:hypothetical protein